MTLQIGDFSLPPPYNITGDEQFTVTKTSLDRIRDGSTDFDLRIDAVLDFAQPGKSSSPRDLSMLLLVRMATRVADSISDAFTLENPDTDPDEKVHASNAIETFRVSRSQRLREILCDYIMTDFPSR